MPKAIYPTDIIFKKDEIVSGGSALFIIGKFYQHLILKLGIIYMFYGI